MIQNCDGRRKRQPALKRVSSSPLCKIITFSYLFKVVFFSFLINFFFSDFFLQLERLNIELNFKVAAGNFSNKFQVKGWKFFPLDITFLASLTQLGWCLVLRNLWPIKIWVPIVFLHFRYFIKRHLIIKNVKDATKGYKILAVF